MSTGEGRRGRALLIAGILQKKQIHASCQSAEREREALLEKRRRRSVANVGPPLHLHPAYNPALGTAAHSLQPAGTSSSTPLKTNKQTNKQKASGQRTLKHFYAADKQQEHCIQRLGLFQRDRV